MRRDVLLQIVFFAAAVLPSSVAAQPAGPGIGAWSMSGESGSWAGGVWHGWALIDGGVGGEPSRALVHLPPRRRAGSSDGVARGAVDGSVRTAAMAVGSPEAMVAHGGSVFLIYGPSGREAEQRPVVSLTAVDTGIADLWRYTPEGRLEVRPALPSRGRLMGTADSPVGPAVLVDEEAGAGSDPRLWVLSRGAWRGLELAPDAARGVGGAWSGVLEGSRLIASERGLAMVGGGAEGGLGLWVIGGDELRRGVAAEEPATLGAEFEPQPRLAGALLPRAVALEAWGRLTLVDRAEQGTLGVRQLAVGGSVRDLARVPAVPNRAAVVWLAGAGRVVAVWRAAPGEASGTGGGLLGGPGAIGSVRIVELSGLSGRVLYAGAAVSEVPISPRRFRAIVLALLVLMGAVLVVVLRQPQADSIVLPEGTALAEAGRRVAASAVDGVLALGIASAGWGVPGGQLVSVAAWIAGPALMVVLTAVAVGVVGGALLEGLWGRTPGKLLFGCEVVLAGVGADPGPRRPPGLLRALARNLVKWIMPPAALLGLMDQGGSGRGGVLGGTRVVVRVDRSGG
ncbi:MAG: RDD family protein [Phycisphaerae bacterium]|nr:RDD family protein [Phycisphaerae bacterium]